MAMLPAVMLLVAILLTKILYKVMLLMKKILVSYLIVPTSYKNSLTQKTNGQLVNLKLVGKRRKEKRMVKAYDRNQQRRPKV